MADRWRWIPALVVMAVIFGFSSIPRDLMPQFDWLDWLVKKGGHFTVYAALAASIIWGRRGMLRNITGRDAAIAVIAAALYGLSDEFHQTFVPGRGPRLSDVLIDTLGALTAALTVWRLSWRPDGEKTMKRILVTGIVTLIVAASLWWQREALSAWAWSLTGEEEVPAQLRGLLQLATDVTRPRLDLRAETPVAYAGMNPYGINTFLEQEVEEAKREHQLQLIAEAGFTWIRQEFPWYDIEIHAKNDFEDRRFEPHRSTWDKYDNIVELAGQNGIEIIARLSAPPEWSRADGTARGPFAPPDDLQDYADYAAAVAGRYAGQITYFQIWNEPNIYPEWGEQAVDPEAYTEMLCRAYDAIKQANPQAVVLAGALAPTASLTPRDMNDLIYLERMYAAGAGDCFDIMSVQGYGLWSGPTDHRMRPVVINYARNQYIRDIMVTHGDADKAIWISEMNWNTTPPDSGIYPNYGQVTLDQQARFAPQAYQRAQQEWPWVGVVNFWFFKRPADYERGESWYYFRMAEPDFTLMPVYAAMQDYIHTQRPTLYPGYHQEDHWAIDYSPGWETASDEQAVLGRYIASTTEQATLDVWIDGGEVWLVTGSLGPDATITYQIDGTPRTARIPANARGDHYQQPILLAYNLPPGPHHLRLVAGGEPLVVDALIVRPRQQPTPAWMLAGLALVLLAIAYRQRNNQPTPEDTP